MVFKRSYFGELLHLNWIVEFAAVFKRSGSDCLIFAVKYGGAVAWFSFCFPLFQRSVA